MFWASKTCHSSLSFEAHLWVPIRNSLTLSWPSLTSLQIHLFHRVIYLDVPDEVLERRLEQSLLVGQSGTDPSSPSSVTSEGSMDFRSLPGTQGQSPDKTWVSKVAQARHYFAYDLSYAHNSRLALVKFFEHGSALILVRYAMSDRLVTTCSVVLHLFLFIASSSVLCPPLLSLLAPPPPLSLSSCTSPINPSLPALLYLPSLSSAPSRLFRPCNLLALLPQILHS